MANLAMTPAEIDEIPAHDVLALLRYWRAHPPTAEILAAAYRVAPQPAPDPDDPSGIGALIARTPDGIVGR